MREAADIKNFLNVAYRILYFLLPLPLTYLSLHLIGSYYLYYDLGVNNNANNGYLTIIVAPVLLTAMYAIAILVFYLTRRLLSPGAQTLLLGNILLWGGTFGTFFMHYNPQYIDGQPQDISAFLIYYFLG